MKLNKLIILGIVPMLLTSCGSLEKDEYPSVFTPTGSTLLGIADYAYNNKEKVTIGDGTAVASNLLNGNFDVVIAPISAGLTVYQKKQNYKLDNVFVWGNVYLLSTNEIKSIDDIAGKTITAFQKSNTPGIVLQSILKKKNIGCTLNYVDSVSTATAAFMSGSTEYVLCAEPSVSNVLSKKQNVYKLDLQSVYQDLFGTSSYPQAGIFVSNSYIEKHSKDYDKYLDLLRDSVKLTNSDTDKVTKEAMEVTDSFSSIGETTLKKSIPGCNFAIKSKQEQKDAIETYINNANSLEIEGVSYVIPDENFYL